MAKNVIKEIIIILLLTLAIILILGVLLYKYTATNKVLPESVSYTTPESLTQELAEANQIQDEQTVLTYEVTAQDLRNYQKTNEYVQGKRNPFGSLTQENTTSGNSQNGTSASGNTNSGSTSSGSSSSGTNTSSGNSDTSNNSQGYFPNKGTK